MTKQTFVSIFFLISEYTNCRVFWCTRLLKFDSEPLSTGQEERCIHAGAALSVCPHGGFHSQVCGSLSCSGVTARGLQDQRDSTGTTLSCDRGVLTSRLLTGEKPYITSEAVVLVFNFYFIGRNSAPSMRVARLNILDIWKWQQWNSQYLESI